MRTSIFSIVIMFYSLTLVHLVSCADHEYLDVNQHALSIANSKSIVDGVDTFSIHVIYNDQHYYSSCEIINDSIFIKNQELVSLQNRLSKLPGFTTLRIDYGIEEYFDSKEDFLKKYGIRDMKEIKYKNNRISRSSNELSIANAVMYEDKDARGKSYNMPIYPSNPFKIYEHPNFNNGPIGNDEVSSLFVNYSFSEPDGCALLEVWENKNYNDNNTETSKHYTYFMASKAHPHHAEYNLKTVQCLNAHDSWNDRISSCKFYLSYIDVLPNPY